VPDAVAAAPAEVQASTGWVHLVASGFGAGAPQLFSGSLLLPGGVRLSDYCNLDDPVLLLQNARTESLPRRFALSKDALDAVWTQQRQRAGDPHQHLELQPVEVHLQTRLLDVVGTLHLAPGADPLEMVLRGARRFVTISAARVSVPGKTPRLDTGIGVCLVNRSHVVAVEPRPSV
jgi:hypothetical protein